MDGCRGVLYRRASVLLYPRLDFLAEPPPRISGGYMTANILQLAVLGADSCLGLYRLGVQWGEFGLFGGDLKPQSILADLHDRVSLHWLDSRTLDLPAIRSVLGFQEEFFFRGVMQPLFISVTKKPFWESAYHMLLPFCIFPILSPRLFHCSLGVERVASTTMFGL